MYIFDRRRVGFALAAAALPVPAAAARQPTQPPQAPAAAPAEKDFVALSETGKRAYEAGRIQESLSAYRRAVAACEKTCPSNTLDLAVLLGAVGLLLVELERPADALAPLERSLALIGSNREVEPDTYATNLDMLTEALRALGRFAEAEPRLAELVAWREKTLGEAHEDTLQAMLSHGVVLADLARYADAQAILARAGERADRALGGEHQTSLMIANAIASIAFRTGDHATADAAFLRVIEARERTLGPDHQSTLVSVNNLARSYFEQDRLDEAEALYARALEGMERQFGADDPRTMTVGSSLASIYLRRGNAAKAEPIFRDLLERERRIRGENSREALVALNNLASALGSLGRLAEAEALHEQELAASRTLLGPEHPDTLTSMLNLVSLRWQQNRLAEADPLAAEALATAERALGPTHPATLSAARWLVTVRLGNGGTRVNNPGYDLLPTERTAHETFRLGTGSALEPARKLLTAARAARDLYVRAGGEGPGVAGKELNEAYSFYADATYWRGFVTPPERPALDAEAFVVLQEAMDGAATEAIVRMAARRYANDPRLDTLIRELEKVIELRAANTADFSLSFTMGGAGAAAERERLRTQRAELDRRKAQLEGELRTRFPDYFTLVQPNPLDLAAAQALLAEDEAILMVVPGPLATQIVVVTRTGVDRHLSSWSADIMADAVRHLRWDLGAQVRADEGTLEQLRRRSPPGAPLSFDRHLAHRLYQQLTHNVADSLAGKKKVFVAAGGALSGLPFSVLVTQPPQGANDDPAALRATSWLADRHVLVHIPSVQALALLRRAGPAAGPRGPASFRGFGNPQLEGPPRERGPRNAGDTPSASDIFRDQSAPGGSTVDVARLRRMARLPGTARELEDVRRTLGAPASSLMMGERATERAVRSADLSRVRLLAFATHGLTSGEVDGIAEAGLVLTPPAQPSAADDGFLAASEVSALRLAADWVILSACNTATGEGAEGQGLSGLARAFFYAGASNLLASHWPVSDEVAPVLIARTLELDQAGRGRAEAFQQAMREVRMDAARDTPARSWAHPFFWAPFVLIGGDPAHPSATTTTTAHPARPENEG